MTPAPRSLQARVLAWVVSGVVVVWLVSAAATWLDVSHEIDELLDGHLAQAAALLVVQQVSGADADGEPGRHVDAPTLHPYAPRVAFQVFHDGRLLMHSDVAPTTPMVPVGQGAKGGFHNVAIAGQQWRVFSAAGSQHDLWVVVAEQVESRADILHAALLGTLGPMLLALPLLALAAWWAVRQGLAPLRELGRTLASRQPQALQPVPVANAPAEMRPLLDALNGLFARITALLESERRFTADAAHELRTPIAGIRAQAQVALGEPDAALRQHALSATLAGCDRATRLVDQLLTLSRLDANAQPALAQVDLAALVRQVVGDLAPQAINRQQNIALQADAACLVRGDATLLAVLVRNLVDNAIRYSPPGATVQATVSAHGGAVCLAVDDSGPGMAELDLQRVGERFFRVLGNGAAGSGLGWSIAQRIAQVHGAALRASRSATLGGLSVVVHWPAP